jgi:outer membrane protein assembly factor BamE (lipoprotein component of BamABCDE complex)
MASQPRTAAAIAAVAGLAIGLSACTNVRGHQGYVMDSALVASIQPGVDNRESVRRTLGDPSIAAQFDNGTWYYVSRTTKQFSFGVPKPVAETVLAVNFDPRGNVTTIKRTGLEEVSSINPVGDKTPTLGRKRSLAQELFGNIGAIGSTGAQGPTADNPGGSSGN